jgi:uncharacterized protein (DUF1015 family)
MARIEPFRGIRYDLGRVGALSDVVSPPYDVIDATLQQQLSDRHPQNSVRMEFTKTGGSGDPFEPYARAGRFWKDWQQEGILRPDGQPSLYVLHQHFQVEGRPYVRKGVFARVRLERFGEGAIFPHEQTLSAPKEDRFRLMQATQANLSPLFGIYPDPSGSVQECLEKEIARQLPIEAVDHLEVTSRVWPVAHPGVIGQATALLHDKSIFIADGHHRYETALRYRDELEKRHGPLPEHHPAQGVLMALVGMNDPGLLILPTHRLIQGYPGLTATKLQTYLEPHFQVTRIGSGSAAAQEAWEQMELEGSQDVLAFGTRADDAWILARFRAGEWMQRLAPEHSDAWRELAVSRLHVMVLSQLLAPLGQAAYKYVHLLAEASNALERREFDLACLVPPATLEHVTAIAGGLEKMPPKSTYFYPKLLTGLVFHSLR